MSNESNQARAVFVEAVEYRPDQRAAFLDHACGGDAELRERVERLLRSHEQLRSFHDADTNAGATLNEPATRRPATRIGPYKLLQQLGEGGMGVVYMAEQTVPVERRVALKVIKPGMGSRQIIARFEAEKQALALMDHVNIARVLDAGTIGETRPYFVMELVHGVPITKYCDDNQLTLRERLELFVPVCQAIQHAHQKGIIHRDIKPSNVMVTLYDGKPVPKVIDFGVAKATEQKLTERTLFTRYGTMVGTLEYMSPEQAEMSALGVDTRSDIFSLGVLLYELLTGSTPISHERMKEVAYAEILRLIREEEAPKPSTRLSDSGQALASISANRHTEPAKLSKLMRGELDWIVMKTLEKDRSRRYATAGGFAADVQRYLNDEPVQACPPSARYRLGKFARRHKAGLATTGLVLFFLVLLGGGVGWTVSDRTTRQRRIGAQVDSILGEVVALEKEQKWPEALAAARRAEALTTAEAGAAIQEHVRQVLHDLQMVDKLQELRLQEARGAETGRYIDEGRPRLYAAAFRDFGVDVETLPAEESAARLRAHSAVALALVAALDDWARAERPQAHGDRSKQLWALATALDPDPWRVSVRQASAAMDVESLMELANAPDMARQPPESQLLLASSLWRCARLEQALALLDRACEIYPGDFWIHYCLAWLNSKVRPARWEAAVRHGFAARALRPRIAATWSNLSIPLGHQGKRDEAIACCRKAIQLDPKSAMAHNHLGLALRARTKSDEAVACFHKAIELDPKCVEAHNNLGNALRDQKKLDEAVVCFRKAIQLDPENAAIHSNLGYTLCDQGKLDEAIACCRQAIELDSKSASAYDNLGKALGAQRKLDEAVAFFQKAIELDPKNAHVYFALGNALYSQKKSEEAIVAYGKVIELDPKYTDAHFNLGVALRNQKKLDEATACFHKAIELGPKCARFYSNLGSTLSDQRKWDEAIAACRQAIELDPKCASAYSNLGNALGAQKKLDEAITYIQKAVELDPKSAYAYFALGNALYYQKELEDAIAAYGKVIELDPIYTGAHFNLGVALSARKRLDEATTAFRQAIELDPKNASAHYNLGGVLYAQQKLDEAAAALRMTLDIEPNHPAAIRILGRVHARRGRWKEAAASFGRAVELDSDDAWAEIMLAAPLAELGDLAAYQGYCRKLLTRRAEIADPHLAEQTAMACLLLPRGVNDLEQLTSLVNTALASDEKSQWYGRCLATKGLHDYRSGRFDVALVACRTSRDRMPSRELVILDYCVEAMAYHRRGDTDMAKTALTAARKLFDEKAPKAGSGDWGADWYDWLTCRILCREAESLVGLRPVPPPESNRATRVTDETK